MTTKNWALIRALFVLSLIIATVPSIQAQLTIGANSTLTAPFSATYDPQNDEVDYGPDGLSFNLTISLNYSHAIPVTFTGAHSDSWGNVLNWDGNNLAVTAGSIAVDVFQSRGSAVGTPAWTLVKDVYNAFGQNGGPTEKSVSGGVELFKYQTSDKDPLFSGQLSLTASLDVKFDVTIPTGKSATMDQAPVVLQSLVVNSSANLAANSSLDVRTDLNNHGSIINLGGTVEGNFLNDGDPATGAGATISSDFSVQGTFSNPGSLTIQAGGSLNLSTSVVNAGEIILHAGTLNLPGGLTNNGVLSGYTIGAQQTNIENYGLISANANGMTLTIGNGGAPTINNYGSLTATNGGTLSILTATINGGIITADNGSVFMDSAIINGSTLNGGNGDLFTIIGCNFNQVINNAKISVHGGLTISGGSLVNNNTITVVGTSTQLPQLFFASDTNVTGDGEVILNFGSFNGNAVNGISAVTVTANQLIHGYGLIQTNVNTHAGISADVNGMTLTIGNGGAPTINNYGSLTATNGGTLSILAATINGGIITADNGSVFMDSVTINGSTLNGGNGDLFTIIGCNFNQVINDAKILVRSGLTISGGSLVNNSTITVLNGAIDFDSGTNVTGIGEIVIQNANLTGGKLTQGKGHTLRGVGTISNQLFNAGTLEPGFGIGTLQVNNSVSLLDTSVIRFEIGGTAQGSTYDYLAISGSISVDGALDLDMANGFESQITNSETFTILTSGSLSGSFANVANGERLTTEDGLGSFIVNYGPSSPYGSNDVVLSQEQIVPEPGMPALLIGGLASLFGLRVRRRVGHF